MPSFRFFGKTMTGYSNRQTLAPTEPSSDKRFANTTFTQKLKLP